MDLELAMHFQAQRYDGWTPPIVLCSATQNKNIDQIYAQIKNFQKTRTKDILQKRHKQSVSNMWTYISNITMSAYCSLYHIETATRLQEEEMTHPFQQHIRSVKDKLTQSHDYLPYEAAEHILGAIFGEEDADSSSAPIPAQQH